jgi:uncharacterized paraquat-inducible protein A
LDYGYDNIIHFIPNWVIISMFVIGITITNIANNSISAIIITTTTTATTIIIIFRT